jgi:hypothetical protein
VLDIGSTLIRAIARKLAGADTMLKPRYVNCDSNDIKYGYLSGNNGELPQKRYGNERGERPEECLLCDINTSLNLPRSPIGEEQKKPEFSKQSSSKIFSWEKEGSREEPPITLPISNHPIRVEQPTINHSSDKIIETPDDLICSVDGCTNPRFDVGYGRYTRRCEHHHAERLRDGSRQRLVQVVYLD